MGLQFLLDSLVPKQALCTNVHTLEGFQQLQTENSRPEINV